MKNRKKSLLHWLVAAGVAGALIGGWASARPAECIKCYPCGSGSDGGDMMCCDYVDC